MTYIPTKAETIAALFRFSEIRRSMLDLLSHPQIGHDDIRHEFLLVAARMVESRALTFSETIDWLRNVPGEPAGQRDYAEQVFRMCDDAQIAALSIRKFRDVGIEWAIENQAEHIANYLAGTNVGLH